MLTVCDGLERVRLFNDDTVCFSKDSAEHLCDPESNFERVTTFGLKQVPKKAFFDARTINCLGHRVTENAIEPDPSNVKAITILSMPTNICQLRSLLGALFYYWTFASICN